MVAMTLIKLYRHFKIFSYIEPFPTDCGSDIQQFDIACRQNFAAFSYNNFTDCKKLFSFTCTSISIDLYFRIILRI